MGLDTDEFVPDRVLILPTSVTDKMKQFGSLRFRKNSQSQSALMAGSLRGHCKWAVDSQLFDLVMTLLVILNSVMIGLQTEYMAVNLTSDVPLAYQVSDIVFCAVFAAELALRLGASGLHTFYVAEASVWNYLDTVLLALQVFELGSWVTFLIVDANSQEISLRSARNLRMLRILRISRLLRVTHLVRELRTILVSIASALKSLCWTILLLFLVMYIVGIFLTQLVTEHFVQRPELLAKDETVREHCGTVLRSIISLYMAITGGIDWDEFARPLSDSVGQGVWLLMLMYTAFCLLCLMNIVTSVFVEGAHREATQDSEDLMLTSALAIFSAVDTEKRGKVEAQEFLEVLMKPSLQPCFKGLGIDPMAAFALFKLSDQDNSGEIRPEAFLKSCMATRGPAKAIDLACFQHEFRSSLKLLDLRLKKVLSKLYHQASEDAAGIMTPFCSPLPPSNNY